jgi:hypothetical protein
VVKSWFSLEFPLFSCIKPTLPPQFKNTDNDGSQKKSGEEMQALYKSFCEEYPIVSIEDPFVRGELLISWFRVYNMSNL